MSQRYASGKNAHAFCDRCGFRMQYAEARTELVQGRPNNLRVCPSCWDADHPQNWLGSVRVDDPQALRNPRPDPALEESRAIP